MKLARKISFALVLVVVAVLGINAYLRVGRERELFESDMRRDHLRMGRALCAAITAVWATGGEAAAAELIRRAGHGEDQVGLRWIWLDAPAPALPPALASALARGEEVARVEEGPAGRLDTYIPVKPDGARKGALELSESLVDEQRYIGATIRNAAVTTSFLAAACGLVTMALGLWFVGRPMRALVQQARRVGAGDFAGRLALRQRDEIGELAVEMNAMCSLLAGANEQLRHADRLATVGQLASGVAHELGTPLNVVHARAKLIAQNGEVGPEVQNGARVIADQAERMTKIIRQLLDFARRREPKKQGHDLAEIARQTLGMLGPMAEKKRVTMSFPQPPEGSARAHVDAGQIQQVVTNLVVNAIQAMPGGGEITLELGSARVKPPPGVKSAGEAEEGEFLRLIVRDQGHGIPPAALPHIFEPFFTTKDVGEGTGLGLSVSYGIVTDHGGWIAVESQIDKGSQFAVYLPKARPE